MELEITVAEVQKKRADTGGVCHDWLQVICDGPGMQVRQSQPSTDFFADDSYARAELVAVDGRRLTFKVETHDEREKLGEGTHIRAIIILDRFMARLQEKAKPKRLSTLAAATELLKISPEILRRHARNGVIPASKEGRSWRFSKGELEKWLSSGGPQVAMDADTSPWGK